MDSRNQNGQSRSLFLRPGGPLSAVVGIMHAFVVVVLAWSVVERGSEAQTLADPTCPADWVRLTEPTLSFCHPANWVREVQKGPDGSQAIVIRTPDASGGFILSYLDIPVADRGKDSEQLATVAYERVFDRETRIKFTGRPDAPYPLSYKLGGKNASLTTLARLRTVDVYVPGSRSIIAFSTISPPIMTPAGQAFGRARELAEQSFRFESLVAATPPPVAAGPLLGSWGFRAAIYLQKTFVGDIDHRIEFRSDAAYRYDARLINKDGEVIQEYSYTGTYRLDPRTPGSPEWFAILALTPRPGGATPLFADAIRYNGLPDHRERRFHVRWKEFPSGGEQRIRLELRGTDSTETWYMPRLPR